MSEKVRTVLASVVAVCGGVLLAHLMHYAHAHFMTPIVGRGVRIFDSPLPPKGGSCHRRIFHKRDTLPAVALGRDPFPLGSGHASIE